MNGYQLLATARRVLAQLSHDHRTLGLLFVVPPLLLTVLKYVFQGQAGLFGRVAPLLLAIFPMIMMFLITSIVTLRERRGGTLDRLMALPVSKLDLILGYAAAFSLVALVQAAIASAVMLGPLDVTVQAGALPTLALALLSALLGTALGLFLSAFAGSEFQAVQFMPAFIFPQLLVCGLFVARDQMARGLQWFADAMPLTYAVDAMRQLALHGGWTDELWRDVATVAVFVVAALVLASVTIRRQARP